MSPSPSDAEDRSRAERAAAWSVRLKEQAPTDELREELDAWLKVDPRNRQTLEEIIAAWHAVDQHAASAQMMAMREAALAEARQAFGRGRAAWAVCGRPWLAAAALLLVLGGFGFWYWLTPQVYSTAVGERRVVVLADGSHISLDAATTVRVAYSRDRRQLWLEHGRAKFDVAKDPLRPFTVSADDKIVVATGTSFSVERIGDQVRVVLYEGHVAVLESRGGAAPYLLDVGPKRIPAGNLLTAGKELILPAEKLDKLRFEPAALEPVDVPRSLSWESGLLVFDDEPLALAVARMNRYASKPLVLGDAGVSGLKVSGVFRAGDTTAFIEGLTAAFGVQVRQGPNGTTLLDAPRDTPSNPPAS
ncbi:MAG TPA: FecR domain-containing protein [Steroidobacteraceae bacterium]|jgi:transmembrane sensor|nr:FecR domain-containing protein [Steroidobacteraceae bacterium]